MAGPDMSATNAVSSRLDYLLQRARIVKPSVLVDPPLQVADLVPENESLLGDIEGSKDVRFLAVESAARSVFYANIVSCILLSPIFRSHV
jgi:THO complex subunit 1